MHILASADLQWPGETRVPTVIELNNTRYIAIRGSVNHRKVSEQWYWKNYDTRLFEMRWFLSLHFNDSSKCRTKIEQQEELCIQPLERLHLSKHNYRGMCAYSFFHSERYRENHSTLMLSSCRTRVIWLVRYEHSWKSLIPSTVLISYSTIS